MNREMTVALLAPTSVLAVTKIEATGAIVVGPSRERAFFETGDRVDDLEG